ncbi:CBS domain-containing protein [Kosmotoga pacifica]|uniref:CBS domain-containing protein n=1 Tax=Kosmotoga pacifica TaxID=1330330 RepID=UPI00069CAD07|nr:CBS domain-containing protein [Kosmotoga pacifica]
MRNIIILTGKKAQDIMLDPITVKLETPKFEALKLMIQHEVHEVPVVDENQNIIGNLNSIELLVVNCGLK